MRDLISILLLAGGFSRRMRGADKLLEPVDGVPLLRLQADRARQVAARVLVALPDPAGARGAALAGLDVQVVPVAAPEEGMAASIRAGIAALPDGAAGLMILPADMPEIDAADMARLRDRFDPAAPRILRGASADGRPGHPVLFPRARFADLAGLSGDAGARALLRREAASVELVTLPGAHALTDLDTPEAWAAWRAARPGAP
ncbi:nucleotidyltransferase family protein [Roseivivax sp. CAU 1761]